MVYSPAPIPISRGSAKPKVFLHNSLPTESEPFGDDPPSAVFEALRQQIDSGATIDKTLAAIAAAAQNISRASGAAIAMGHDGVVLCVGRSGDTAPELGAQLSVDKGISGECIRSGKSLLCDDTQLDSRVDAEVCLRLGLRSIIAVPLHSPDGMVGILEVFSNYPANFSASHLETMRTLAELVELAHARVLGAEAVAKEIHESMILPVPEAASELAAPAAVATAEPRAIEWLRDSQTDIEAKKSIPYWLAAPVLILILLSVRFWISRHEPPVAVANPIASQPAAPETIEMTIGTKSARKPRAGRSGTQAPAKSSKQHDKSSEAPEVVVHNFDQQATTDSASPAIENPSPAAAASSSAQTASQSIDPPQLPVLNANNASLANLVAKPATLPRQPLPVSQGLVRGALEYRTQPKYPEQALAMRISGQVVLLANISESGAVKSMKVISGPPALADAAMAAVRQWHYQPSRLNGTPIAVDTQVTVNFKAP